MEPVRLNHLAFLSREYEPLLSRRISQVLQKAIFFNGPEVELFEQRLKDFFLAEVITVGSGHDALVLALQSLHLDANDEVIFPANAYPTAFALAQVSCQLKLVDCNELCQIDLDALKKQVTSRTKAIVVVHLYGSCCNMEALMSFAREHNIWVVEDCAQAFGSVWRGKKLGTFGKIGCFSFYPTKNLGAAGDGGAIVTNDPEVMAFCRQAKQYGEKERYQSHFISGHSRLPEIQAAILNIYFSEFSKHSKKKKRVEAWYRLAFRESPVGLKIRIISSQRSSEEEVHLFVSEVPKRDKLQQFLNEELIETAIHYPVPVHLTAAFSSLGYQLGNFPVAEKLARGIISLPYHPYLKKSHVQRVVRSLEKFYLH